MLFGLVQRRHHLRVLNALRRKSPQRFNELKAATGLESAQLSRVLLSLNQQVFVITRTIPTTGDRIPVEYLISKKAENVLAIWDRMHAVVHGLKTREGHAVDREMKALTR